MDEEFKELVVVITGASSGIGRAAAKAFAEKGAALVLAARSEERLVETQVECAAVGEGRLLAVSTDVSHSRDVSELANRAIAKFGRIDVWINNAGVDLYGRIDEVPLDEEEQVLKTNLFGCLYGSRTAVAHFRERGSGTLINVSSAEGTIGKPFSAVYAASKWGVRGLTASLRMELADQPRISVCTLLPASIDTPLFQHAGNYVGREIRPMDPVYPVDAAAQAIVDLVRHPKREVFVGMSGRLMAASRAVSPAAAERAFTAMTARTQIANRPTRTSPGNIFHPMRDRLGTTGGWMGNAVSGRRLDTAATAMAIAAVGVPLGFLAWRLASRPAAPMRRH